MRFQVLSRPGSGLLTNERFTEIQLFMIGLEYPVDERETAEDHQGTVLDYFGKRTAMLRIERCSKGFAS